MTGRIRFSFVESEKWDDDTEFGRDPSEGLECPHCDMEADSPEALDEHIAENHGVECWCGETFGNREDRNEHYREEHENGDY